MEAFEMSFKANSHVDFGVLEYMMSSVVVGRRLVGGREVQRRSQGRSLRKRGEGNLSDELLMVRGMQGTPGLRMVVQKHSLSTRVSIDPTNCQGKL